MMELVVYTADVVQNAQNCIYPNRVEAKSAEELREAVKKDHVCAEYKDNRRSKDNFIKSNVAVMDCDNDHSEDPDDWITLEILAQLLGNYSYAVALSRNHMKEKDGKSARPRFHVYFEIDETTDPDQYAAIKRAIKEKFQFFDGNALDAARFIFGADAGEVEWHEGWMTVDQDIDPVSEDDGEEYTGGQITVGSRNKTMSRFAAKILKRLGKTEKAHEAFMQHADHCEPPLDAKELDTIWKSAEKFYDNKVAGSGGYIPPDQYAAEFANASMKPADYSDIGEAKVFLRFYGNEIRYSAATDFLRYDGERWVEDVQLAIAAVEEFTDLQLLDAQKEVETAQKALIAAGVPEAVVKKGSRVVEKNVPDDKLSLVARLNAAETYEKFVIKHRDYKYITSTANAAKPMVCIDVGDLDKDENLLNTPMATFDLRKGRAGVQAHDPMDYIMKMTNCNPGDAGIDIWLEALDTFFCGDDELIEYVQLVVGMSAIGRVYQEFMIIAYGDGANGKSTFWNAIFRVLGDYAGKLSAEALTMSCKRNVKPEMAELKGKRLIISSEMEEGMRLNTAIVKQLCSTDEIQAEKKYKAPFHFVPSHTLVLYTNHLPKVGANDHGIWRRLVVIPFKAKIEGTSDIKNYAEYLYENAGEAIMSWILEGARKAIELEYRFDAPAVVQEAIKAYREDNDWMGHFMEDCCEVDPTFTEKSGELYQAYRAYCAQIGEWARPTVDFYTALENAGFDKKKTKNGSVVFGLKLKDGDDFL